MIAPLKFRHRIGLIVVLAAAALVAVTAVTLVLGRRGALQLAGIETRYVPLVELDRDLKTLFAQIPRALEDAAAAAEDSTLRDADALYDKLVARLRAGVSVMLDNGANPVALEAELREYYANARQVAAALVAGDPAPSLAAKIDAMTRARQALTAHLEQATTPDRRRLAAAFAAARASQRNALWLDIAVACAALLLIGVLSRRLIRYTVSTLRAVSIGVERLARGDGTHEIEVTSDDELGELAREANQTAARLREYREQAQHHAAELRDAYATLESRNATLVAAQLLLEERAEELARASRYKSEFLANMSHELRTPLNSIMILSAVLAENRDLNMTAKQLEFATLINRSGDELLALINEVLDLSKIEAGKQVMVIEPMLVADLLDYMRRMFQPLAMQKNLAFEVETSGDLPVRIRTDKARLAQIVKNLIANALKFTERGRVAVRVARGVRGGGERRAGAPIVEDPIEIAVSDTGIGIAAEQHSWIFEAFAQADVGISRKFGGTGLGLTIAKELAIRLGGDLTVESALGAGSTFSVVLPIAGPAVSEAPVVRAASTSLAPPLADVRPRHREAAAPATARAEPGEANLDGKTVMIVDGDMRNVYSLSNALRGKRLEVITAADGQEALDELGRNERVDLVLIDVMMARVDGYEATRQIRAIERFRDLPIIALSAPTTPGLRERCLAAGASDYLAKPVDIAHLLGVLRSWLG
ncbi:MAG TPA: ATP-binding protein [Kofleriaceae bacterium]|nr:ATP-binding protein [Kofleriaceae bacterium]